MMKSLERLISCMVAELSDHVNMDDATFLGRLRVFDARAEFILNNGEKSFFWEGLRLYNEARETITSGRRDWAGFTI